MQQAANYLIIRVVNHWWLPLALVVGVVDHWSLPWAAAGGGFTGGIGDLRCFPLAIHILIPKRDEHRCSAVMKENLTHDMLIFLFQLLSWLRL